MKKKKYIIPTGVLVLAIILWATGCGQEEGFVSFDDASLEMTIVKESTGPQTEVAGENKETSLTEVQKTFVTQEPEQTVFVHVCGAVEQAGVYELPVSARVYDALQKAGGCREEGAPDSLNLAQVLSDGQRIYVPTKEEIEAGTISLLQAGTTQAGTAWEGISGEKSTQGDGSVNLNTAGREELMTLPGIGQAKADSIIQYREENGGFDSPEEIMQIRGIKENIYNRIRDRIIV